MQILRKLLSANEVYSTKRRYNPTTDEVEYSPDDGTTWNSDPGDDPRHVDAYRLPARTGADRRCDAAANMVEWTRAGMAEISTAVGAGSAIVFLVTLFLAFLFTGPFAIFLLLITDLATLLYGLGQTAIDAALTTGFYDYLLCLLWCNIDADGQMSNDQYLAAQVGLAAWGGNAGDAVGRLYEIAGEVGLSNSGAVGAETDDCSACECAGCYEWTQAELEIDWTFSFGANGDLSTYCTIAAGAIYIGIEFSWTADEGAGGSGGEGVHIYGAYNYADQLQTESLATAPSPYVWEDQPSGQAFNTGISLGGNAKSGSGGSVTITHIKVTYIGATPAAFVSGSLC